MGDGGKEGRHLAKTKKEAGEPEVPTAVPNIDGHLLDPRSCWADPSRSGCLEPPFRLRPSVGAAWGREVRVTKRR